MDVLKFLGVAAIVVVLFGTAISCSIYDYNVCRDQGHTWVYCMKQISK